MDFFNSFPWQNSHQLNLDWILNRTAELLRDFEGFKAVNTVTFGGVWDIKKNYPAWTIVAVSNDAYISIKPVPVGIPITNTSFWLLSANLDPRLASALTQINSNRDDIAKLKTSIQNLKRRIIFIGDSYLSGIGGDGYDIPNTISSLIDCEVESYAQPGAGFLKTVDDNNFVTLSNKAAKSTNFDKKEVTNVVIIGGYNDLGITDHSFSALSPKMAEIRENLKVFTNASILVIAFPWINLIYNADYPNLCSAISLACERQGFACSKNALDWLRFIPDVNYDSVHPNHNGYTIIAKRILSIIMGTADTTLTPESAYTITQTDDQFLRAVKDQASGVWFIKGTFKKLPGAVFNNIGKLPDYLGKQSLTPVRLYQYNGTKVLTAIIFDGVITIGSDTMNENEIFLVNCPLCSELE